jgi:hypothetical protein
MFKARLAAVAVAASIVFGGSLVVAAPASAAPAHCAAGAGCTYENTGFTSGWLGFQNSISDYGNHLFSGTNHRADNAVSSFYNNGRHQAINFYKDRNKGRPPFKLGLGKYDSNLHDGVGTPAGWHDVIGSSYFVQ